MISIFVVRRVWLPTLKTKFRKGKCLIRKYAKTGKIEITNHQTQDFGVLGKASRTQHRTALTVAEGPCDPLGMRATGSGWL